MRQLQRWFRIRPVDFGVSPPSHILRIPIRRMKCDGLTQRGKGYSTQSPPGGQSLHWYMSQLGHLTNRWPFRQYIRAPTDTITTRRQFKYYYGNATCATISGCRKLQRAYSAYQPSNKDAISIHRATRLCSVKVIVNGIHLLTSDFLVEKLQELRHNLQYETLIQKPELMPIRPLRVIRAEYTTGRGDWRRTAWTETSARRNPCCPLRRRQAT